MVTRSGRFIELTPSPSDNLCGRREKFFKPKNVPRPKNTFINNSGLVYAVNNRQVIIDLEATLQRRVRKLNIL